MLDDYKNDIVNLNNYIYWIKARVVKPYIINYLKEKFLNDLILFEFNKVDLIVLNQELPVEIQSTIINKHNNSNKIYSIHSAFENSIRKQLEDNIENYGKCWFFFDSEYYRYLSESTSSNISLNLDWFAKYVKENKLKVFTVKYDGVITELNYNNLTFIKKVSNTCMLEYNEDRRILNRNKIKIMKNVINGYKFTQDEYNKFIDNFVKRENKKIRFSAFLRGGTDKREILYGNLSVSIGNLEIINNFLNMDSNYNIQSKYFSKSLGLFEINGSSQNGRTQFIDKFNVAQFFPGYVRHKELWNSLKNKLFSDKNLRYYFNSKNNKIKMINEYE